jgi:hypothetical protein
MMHNDTAPDERQFLCMTRLSSGIRILVLITFLFIGLKIIRYGYIPPDDVRRHAARAITGREYTDILVLRPEYKMDHNAGWDWLLGQLHVKAGLGEDQLVVFSMAVLLFGMLCAPLPWMRCPEAWLAALLAFILAIPGITQRFAEGRPYLLTEGVLIALLLAWAKPGNPSWSKIILTSAGFALSVWLHGSWYLWAVLPAAFFLAGQWRAGTSLALCWVAGAIFGALLTGHPLEFLRQGVVLAWVIFHEGVAETLLVTEFQSSSGEFMALLILAIMFIWRRGKSGQLFRAPLFWLMVVCWILGLKVVRFWVDWGLPAALVWLALQFEEMILASWAALPARRLIVSILLALSLFLVTTSDLGGRYSGSLRETFVDASDPTFKGWMPEKGGIFYGADMMFFYNTFYKNPNGDWRYIVGFEPALMPPEDLKVYRAILWSQYSWAAYEPWVLKMRPQDRLEISSATQPVIPALEWINSGANVWIGRLPKSHPARRSESK